MLRLRGDKPHTIYGIYSAKTGQLYFAGYGARGRVSERWQAMRRDYARLSPLILQRMRNDTAVTKCELYGRYETREEAKVVANLLRDQLFYFEDCSKYVLVKDMDRERFLIREESREKSKTKKHAVTAAYLKSLQRKENDTSI